MQTTPPESADWNAADAEYMAMMVTHHGQALEMAELAVTRASDPQVLALAEGIDAGQGLEILVMADWLADHGLPEPAQPDGDHDMAEMSGMVGMLSDEQLDELAAAQGPEFDRLFLDGMIQHHEGALTMASTVLAEGEDQRTNELATDVSAGQTAEISRMETLLDRL